MTQEDLLHIKELAEQMQRDQLRAARYELLRVRRTRGGLLAVCRACPEAVRDSRRFGVWAFYSSTTVQTPAGAVAWFDAHRQTEMHEWYEEQDRGVERVPFEHVKPVPFGRRRKKAGQ